MDILYSRFVGKANNLPFSSVHRLTIGESQTSASVIPFYCCCSFPLVLLKGQLGKMRTCYRCVAIYILNFCLNCCFIFCFICHIYPPFTRKRIVSLYFGREIRTRLGVAFFEVCGPPVFHIKVGRPVKCLAQGHNKRTCRLVLHNLP